MPSEARARVMFHDLKLKRGRSWIRVADSSFFCDKMQLPDLYANMFWEAIVRGEVGVVRNRVINTPVVNLRPWCSGSSS